MFLSASVNLEAESSRFKGNNLPVETISWYDTEEFCKRLSKHTGRKYRLPSEAEWEYGRRGGTTAPFNFGGTITTDLANYRGTDDGNISGSYGDGPKGVHRRTTTDVGNFDAPNHDMHGNIWEWCLDDWHENYVVAPRDGSCWLNNDNHFHLKVLRGGSWGNGPDFCRSAYRRRSNPVNDTDGNLGFRLVCGGVPSRILP